MTQKLPQICTVILRIRIGKVAWFAVHICGNFWVTQYYRETITWNTNNNITCNHNSRTLFRRTCVSTLTRPASTAPRRRRRCGGAGNTAPTSAMPAGSTRSSIRLVGACLTSAYSFHSFIRVFIHSFIHIPIQNSWLVVSSFLLIDF